MRPDRVALVCGTGTEVGKTWVAARLLVELRGQGRSVAARKPAQSFDVGQYGEGIGGATDAEALGAASGEHPGDVCHSFRSYHRAMAPPIAARALGMPPFTVADLVEELAWPRMRVEVGVVETAGGVRSPQAEDGDVCDLVAALAPDLVVLVADAGLGTINSIRMTMDALAGPTTALGGVPVVVVLNRYDGKHEIHRRNHEWLLDREGYRMVMLPGGESELAGLVAGG
ncbi:MAG TPA: dethiobiotin synthase [Acidimicrobiales bacterium]